MKKILFIISALIFSANIYAQSLDDMGRLAIHVQRPHNNTIPQEAINLLEEKMHQIITINGISDNSINRRFALISSINIIKKNITNTSPARVVQTLEITFYVQDIIDKKNFGNISISTTGIGQNVNKSFIMAFSNLKPNNPQIKEMLNNSKELIISYYRTNIDRILSEADLLAQQGKYNKALFILAQIPDVCTDCTEKSYKKTIEIYYKKIDSEGANLLQLAQMAWSSSPNKSGASTAMQYLSNIHSMAYCQTEVEKLIQEIKAKIKEDERKAWEFELQKYNDAKLREQRDFEFRVRQYEEREAKEQSRYEDELAREHRNFEFEKHRFNQEHEKNMAIISASREVALEFAKNIPNTNLKE